MMEFGKDTMIVQNMCLVKYYNRHASFVFFFLFPFFFLTYSRKPQGQHQCRNESANSKCLLHQKKKKKEKKEKVNLRFFFRHQPSHSFIQRLILIDDRQTHINRENKISHFFFFSFFVSLSFSLCYNARAKTSIDSN
jgi:hypothetical protein